MSIEASDPRVTRLPPGPVPDSPWIDAQPLARRRRTGCSCGATLKRESDDVDAERPKCGCYRRSSGTRRLGMFDPR